jgi:uncharacterized membrane protein
MTRTSEENRIRQVIVAVVILAIVTGLVCGALIGSRYLPGLMGEWIGMMIGVMTTPFFMEASFVILGLVIVIALNTWRRNRDGDELVFLERVDESKLDGKLPEHASWALYREKPLVGETPSLHTRAEGAVAIGDFDHAAELIASMQEEELKRPETLQLRLDLARATGRQDLAGQLEAALKGSSPGAGN